MQLPLRAKARSKVPAALYGNKQARDWFHLRLLLKLRCGGTIRQLMRLSIQENFKERLNGRNARVDSRTGLHIPSL